MRFVLTPSMNLRWSLKAGDMVRFTQVGPYGPQSSWTLGLLVEYRAWEKLATVLYEGEILRIAAERVQKAGVTDWNESQ